MRVDGNSPVDVWDPYSCGLMRGDGCEEQVNSLSVGPTDTPYLRRNAAQASRDPQPRTGATLYKVIESAYVPYESATMPTSPAGNSLGDKTLKVSFAPPVFASTTLSPLSATTMVASAVIRDRLATGTGGRLLDKIDAQSTYKGGEGKGLVDEYLVRNAATADAAASMAVRDFWAFWYRACFPRCMDWRIPDLASSLMCMSLAIDYVGVPDSFEQSWLTDAYVHASSEGLACLQGEQATQTLREIALFNSFTKTKEAVVDASASIPGLKAFVEASGGIPTPVELERARWWDACYGTLLRVIITTQDYHHLTHADGTWNAFGCDKILRAVSQPIRCNDIPDMLFDYTHKEWLNEQIMAVAVNGGRALTGYGNAVARITDTVLACDCGAPGHEEGAELAMGTVLFEGIHPRYRLRRMLKGLACAEPSIKDAYAIRPAGTRIKTVADTVLLPGDQMYAPDWTPLWTQAPASTRTTRKDIEKVARWVVKRSLSGPRDYAGAAACQAAAETVLADCDRLIDVAALRGLDEAWMHLFDTVIDASVTDAAAREQAMREWRPVVGRIWQEDVVNAENPSVGDPEYIDERIFMDMDTAFQRSFYQPSPEGFAVRRAFLGVVTSLFELSGLNPFARMTDGTAKLFAADSR
ncbi:hypothetical protein [Streptomyces spectabilis]|uniref:Uncharacterized protein n=1 Tax=Streptomyces spectabilis TaxID=68270 RepID=A0A7W8B232_STRST|nr:hypothetical protein [Streptomyces spectabilis]MBB5108934.1 hypothetical protein [Streptomyces spectabilis]GGV50259.1 hypothetical protein GCM10010245_79050 [Streptomyces spectabilis]